MKLTIKITKEVLIKSAYCGLNTNISITRNCAVSVACQGIFPNCQTNYVTINKPEWEITLPRDARQWVRRFDELTPLERIALPEFSFEIDVPDSVIETIGIEEAKAIVEKSSTLEFSQL